MKTNFLISIFCICALTLQAQKLDINHIHSSIEARFNLKLDTVDYCETYVMNGVPFDQEGFTNELKKYEKFDVKFTTLADMTNRTWYHRKCDFIIIVGTRDYDQKKKSKRKELDAIRTNLNSNLPELVIQDYICECCKQVLVDGTPIGMYEARTLVNELRPKNIDYITSYESADPTVFGRNAVNGLIEIFMKMKADNIRQNP